MCEGMEWLVVECGRQGKFQWWGVHVTMEFCDGEYVCVCVSVDGVMCEREWRVVVECVRE